MRYVPDCNEALQFKGDGLHDLLPLLETVVSIPKGELISSLRENLNSGAQARAMLSTQRPDGGKYVTSCLIEEAAKGGFLITKTNEHFRSTHTPVSYDELLSRFQYIDDEVTIGFLSIDEDLHHQLASKKGAELFFCIITQLYGYTVEKDNLMTRHGWSVDGEDDAVGDLVDFVNNHPEEILAIKSDKGLQLRLNKHIANKLQPLWYSWQNYILPDGDLSPFLTERSTYELSEGHHECQNALGELQKRFILLCGRPTPQTYKSYAEALKKLADRHADWAVLATHSLISMIKRNQEGQE